MAQSHLKEPYMPSAEVFKKLMRKYQADASSNWGIRVYSYGIPVLSKDALSFKECQRLYIAQDNCFSQAVVAFVNEKRIPYVDAQKIFYGGIKR